MTSNVTDTSTQEDHAAVAATANAAETPDSNDIGSVAPAKAGEQKPKSGRGQRGGQGRGRGAPQGPQAGRGNAPARQHPVLDQLAALYPALFGETLLPLKRGIFQDLLAAQPEVLDKDSLKAALALHTRSTRYLTAVASGQDRHDLSAQAVEPLAPEHMHHALIEVFRRRGARSREDLRPKMRQRIAVAFEASGLSRDAYLERVSGKDEEVNQITQGGVDEAASRLARDEALLRTFEASGKDLNDFADMYGLHVLEANRTLERAKARRDKAAAAQTAPADTGTAAEPPAASGQES
jgi:ProP effector